MSDSSMTHACTRGSGARLRPLRCRNLMSPTNDHRAGHDTDVELRRRRQVANEDVTGFRKRRGRLMKRWHWNLESSRSVLARLSWIEQAATRSRATVSPWMSVAANGPETDCESSYAAEDARHAGEAARVGAENALDSR